MNQSIETAGVKKLDSAPPQNDLQSLLKVALSRRQLMQLGIAAVVLACTPESSPTPTSPVVTPTPDLVTLVPPTPTRTPVPTATPTGTEQSNPSAKPTPGETPGQTPGQTSGPDASPSPHPTVPTESFPPESLAPVESDAELEAILNKWTQKDAHGNYITTIPEGKRFHLPTGKPADFNTLETKFQSGRWYPATHGYYLATQIIDNHIIAYILQEEMGERYWIPVNAGKIDDKITGVISDDPDRAAFPTGQANAKVIPIKHMEVIMANNFKDDAVVFAAIPFEVASTAIPERVDGESYLAQIQLAKEFTQWSIAAHEGRKPYTDPALLNKYPLVRKYINKVVRSGFSLADVMYIAEWWTPRNDV